MKKFSLVLCLSLAALFLDSCRLVSRISHSIFHKNESQFTIHEIDNLVEAAKTYQGVNYRFGGADELGMDCSGLLFRVYSDQNFIIPRESTQQAEYGLPVSLNAISQGDWLFFRTNGSENINHVGLVTKIGGPKEVLFIHASTTKGVREDNLYSNYWLKAFQKVIRPYKNNSN